MTKIKVFIEQCCRRQCAGNHTKCYRQQWPMLTAAMRVAASRSYAPAHCSCRQLCNPTRRQHLRLPGARARGRRDGESRREVLTSTHTQVAPQRLYQ